MSSTEVATLDAREAALAQTAKRGIDQKDLSIPMLKVIQSLSKEAEEGDAETGDLVINLTGENLGTSVKLVVVDTFKGRFYAPDGGGQSFSVNDQAALPGAIVPNSWPICAGKPFGECPEAEETFSERANSGEIKWEKGPPIQTTFNFICLIVNEDGSIGDIPVRVSLKSGSAKVAKDWMLLTNIAPTPWDQVYELSTYKAVGRKSGKQFAGVKVKPVGKTEIGPRTAAIDLASIIQGGEATVDLEEAAEPENAKKAKPADAGGMGVG